MQGQRTVFLKWEKEITVFCLELKGRTGDPERRGALRGDDLAGKRALVRSKDDADLWVDVVVGEWV